jgi:hypothetical protein
MIRRYKFFFTARVEKDVEFPDDCVEESDAWEKIIQDAACSINVDEHADFEDAYEVDE